MNNPSILKCFLTAATVVALATPSFACGGAPGNDPIDDWMDTIRHILSGGTGLYEASLPFPDETIIFVNDNLPCG